MTRADYDYYDYVLIMDKNNERNLSRLLGRSSLSKVHRLLDFAQKPRDIADPWYTGDFDEAFEDIREGCESFLSFLKESGKI